MLAFYAQIKAVHVAAVLASGATFITRGVLVQLGRERLAMSAGARYASYTIDTVLLVAALLLVTMLPGAVFANHWLTMKLALLAIYIALGSLALKHAATARGRRLSFFAALAVYAAMLGIARAHHPLGWLVQTGVIRAPA